MGPKVTVIVPARAESKYLEATIVSVVDQTYDNIEIIVVDGALKGDDTAKRIVEPYGDKVSYYRQEGAGIAAALNFGAKKMTGQYLSWLSPGDTYDTGRVEKLVALVGRVNNTIAISDWVVVNRNGRKIRKYVVDDRLEKSPGCFLAFARETNLNTCAMLIPADICKENGMFDGSLPCSQDYRLINRLILAGASFKVTNQSLFCYGPHPGQELSIVPTVEYDYDSVRSDIIGTLGYDDITGYFGGKESVVAHYKELLNAGLPRSASFLMEKVIRGSLATGSRDIAERVLLDDLSGLSEGQMATGADILVSKITKPSAKKKVLFCSAHWLTGGMERVMAILFRELRKDYEIFLITPYDERKSHIEVPGFVTSIKVSNELFVGHFDSLALSYALLLDIDVAVGFVNLFEKQLNLYKLCAGTKIKTVASNHEYYFYPYKSPVHYGVVEKRLDAYMKCDALVWANSFNAALCGMYVENNYVIGNPNNFAVAQEVKSHKDKVIICVGRFNDYVKRVDRILRCFSLILQTTPDAKLVLVGKCEKNVPIRQNDNTTVDDLINELAIPPDSINFVGEVNNVQDYYAEAKVLMLASNSEGFGMVLNEAACFGVPLVCNYIPGIEDILNDGENGYIVEQGDINSMALRVVDILNDDGLQKRLGNNARKKVQAYDSEHIGAKWRFLINSLLETKDKDELRKKLSSELGYSVQDQQLFSKVLSRELNEIFYMSINESGQYKITNGAALILIKVIRLPSRLKANIEYEGWLKTASKLATRSYRVARNALKI